MTRLRHDKWHYQGICLAVMEETQISLLRIDDVPAGHDSNRKLRWLAANEMWREKNVCCWKLHSWYQTEAENSEHKGNITCHDWDLNLLHSEYWSEELRLDTVLVDKEQYSKKSEPRWNQSYDTLIWKVNYEKRTKLKHIGNCIKHGK